MSTQQLCLRWNNHHPNFISVFTSLLHNEQLVDVTLIAEGRQLQAHKVVLSACSSYFQVTHRHFRAFMCVSHQFHMHRQNSAHFPGGILEESVSTSDHHTERCPVQSLVCDDRVRLLR